MQNVRECVCVWLTATEADKDHQTLQDWDWISGFHRET